MWEDPWAHLMPSSPLAESKRNLSVATDCTDIGNEPEVKELPFPSFKQTEADLPVTVEKSVSEILDPESPSVVETSISEYHTALDESGLGVQDSEIPSSKDQEPVQENIPVVPVNYEIASSSVEPESTTEEELLS